MAEEAAKERSECICVSISLASLTVAFGGLLALVIYQHSKEVRQENLHGRYYHGSAAAAASAGSDGGGRWSAEEGVYRESGILKDPPLSLSPSSQALPYEPTAQSPMSGPREVPERRLETEHDADTAEAGAAHDGSHGGGDGSRLLDEIEKRVADALGRTAAERGPLTNRLLLDLLGRTPAGRRSQFLARSAASETSTSAPRSNAEPTRTTTAKDGRDARTFPAAAQRSSPRPTTADATSFATDGSSTIVVRPSSPTPSSRAAIAINATVPVYNGRSAASAVMVFVWESVARALRQPVELRWLVLAVAVTAMGTLAFSAVVAAAAAAGRDRDDRSRAFSAPAWWRGERPTAAAAAVDRGGGRHRRGHGDWLSLLQSSDDEYEDDDELNGNKNNARGFTRAAADGRASGQRRRQWRERWRLRSPPPERRDAASEVRAYVQRLRALDLRNDADDDDEDEAPPGGGRGVAGSKESTPLAGCARSYEAIASRQRAELLEWHAGASTIK